MKAFILVALLAPGVATASPSLVNQLSNAVAPCRIMEYQGALDRDNARLAARNAGDTSVPDTSAQVLACYADGRERGKAAYLAYRAQLKTDMLRADASAVYAAWIATLGEPQALNGASTPQDLVLEQAAATLEADSTE